MKHIQTFKIFTMLGVSIYKLHKHKITKQHGPGVIKNDTRK